LRRSEMSSELAPIALFAYNRPLHLRLTVEALKQNELAKKTNLIIYSDGPKGPQDKAAVRAVRRGIGSIEGFRSVSIIEQARNRGLASSIIEGVTQVVNRYGRIIVLEDDLITSPFFLRYMNEALELYESEEKVISVHGYIYSVKEKLPPTFFLRGADCWGWATWKRGWDLFEKDGKRLLDELKEKGLTGQFDFNRAYRFTRMLKRQAAGKGSSWAVRWYASAFLRERLTLYPGVSLVRHIGNDGTGTNFGASKSLDTDVARAPVPVRQIDVVESAEARKIVEKYLRSIKTPVAKAALRRTREHFLKALNHLKL